MPARGDGLPLPGRAHLTKFNDVDVYDQDPGAHPAACLGQLAMNQGQPHLAIHRALFSIHRSISSPCSDLHFHLYVVVLQSWGRRRTSLRPQIQVVSS